MKQRFSIRREQLLEAAEIKPQVYKGLVERMPAFLEPYLEALGRREQRAHLREYLQGLLSDIKRKNVEAIAYMNDQDRDELQHFIGVSGWDYKPMLTELTQQVNDELGETDGVIVIDPSGFKKDGKESVGVQRQWLGRLGKVDNGQVGVYLGYVTRKGHALCDLRLYLPKEWAADKARRSRCGIPQKVEFQTRHELAQAMLLERGPVLRHQWIAGDDEMGRSGRFRMWLREHGEQYLLSVPSNLNMRDLEVAAPVWSGPSGKRKRAWTSVSSWLKEIPDCEWKRIDVRDGEKGPLVVEAVKRRVQAREDKHRVGPEELLFVTRARESSGGWKIDYYLSNAPAETAMEELSRVAKAEHRIEDCFKRAKSEAGLADYEVRTWVGWHHHQTIALLATWFLTIEERRGKKMDACNHGIADSRSDCIAAA